MGQTELIMKYLRENPLKNVTPLKMMTAYHQVIDSYLVHQQEHWGILLLLPADAYSFDQRIYPNAEKIVLMDYSSPEVLPELLKRLPGEINLVFKIQEQTRISIAGQFPLHKVRCFYSYSSTAGQRFAPDAEAVLNEQMDDRLLPLWRANDYSKEEIEHYFADGAFSISIFRGDAPLQHLPRLPQRGTNLGNRGRAYGRSRQKKRTCTAGRPHCGIPYAAEVIFQDTRWRILISPPFVWPNPSALR